jgi:hypothetical protein
MISPNNKELDADALGDYVLTSVPLDENGGVNPHAITNHAARITRSGDGYEIAIQWGRAGVITVPFDVSGKRISFHIRPESGSVDGRDMLAQTFFGENSVDYFAGWSTWGENRKAFMLQRMKPIEPQTER